MLERLLPPRLLRAFLGPASAVVALKEYRKQRRSLDLFPVRWRPVRLQFLVTQPLCSAAARFLTFWPDRLAAPRWRSRCRLTGDTAWMAAAKDRQPVVLVSLHFGPCVLLPYWLRAMDIPVTTMSASRHGRSAFRERRYRLTPQPDLPVVFGVEEIRPAIEHLQAKHTLLMLIDVPRGRQVSVPWEDSTLRLATGALRLAATTGASVVPCLIFETAPWQFTIHSGAPLPAAMLDPGLVPDAMLRLVREWMPIVRKYPEQCEPDLLSCFAQASSPPAHS